MLDRKSHWEQVYQDKNPTEVSWFQVKPSVSLELIAGTGIDKHAYIIDVGGGASSLARYLHDAGYHKLAVLDISAHSLQYARKLMAAHADEVEWLEQDVTQFVPGHAYTLWHDRAVFHFLTEEADRQRYVDVLRRVLARGGHVIIATFAIGGPARCSGLDIVQYDADKLLAVLGDGFDLMQQVAEEHVTPSGKNQEFRYFYLRYRP